MIPFEEKVRKLIKSYGMTTEQFEEATGMARNFLYRPHKRATHKITVLGIAYALGLDAEDLAEGTDVEHYFK